MLLMLFTLNNFSYIIHPEWITELFGWMWKMNGDWIRLVVRQPGLWKVPNAPGRALCSFTPFTIALLLSWLWWKLFYGFLLHQVIYVTVIVVFTQVLYFNTHNLNIFELNRFWKLYNLFEPYFLHSTSRTSGNFQRNFCIDSETMETFPSKWW